jgi:hypothetical protein
MAAPMAACLAVKLVATMARKKVVVMELRKGYVIVLMVAWMAATKVVLMGVRMGVPMVAELVEKC